MREEREGDGIVWVGKGRCMSGLLHTHTHTHTHTKHLLTETVSPSHAAWSRAWALVMARSSCLIESVCGRVRENERWGV